MSNKTIVTLRIIFYPILLITGIYLVAYITNTPGAACLGGVCLSLFSCLVALQSSKG